MSNSKPDRRLRRDEAAIYLKEHWGIDRTPSTLAKYVSVGGGPKFERAGRIPLYRKEFLDDWAQSLLSPPVRSSSELAQLNRQKQSQAHEHG